MTTAALIGAGVAVVLAVIWLAITNARSRGREEARADTAEGGLDRVEKGRKARDSLDADRIDELRRKYRRR